LLNLPSSHRPKKHPEAPVFSCCLSCQKNKQRARFLSENPELTDAYAALYAGVRLNDCCGSGESILVTSTQPNEAKTTVTCSLAITAPLMGQTTLLIDGDLRRPWLAAPKGITCGIGLCNVLEGQAKPAEATRAIELFEDSRETGLLSVMSARRRAPAFLAGGIGRKRELGFGRFRSNLPWCFWIRPLSLPRVTLDGVLLVVGVGSADREDARRAKEQLESIGVPIIGAVLNMFDPKVHRRPSQPYSGYYRGSGR
jgi:protein-tyrosine kinase